MSSTQRPRAAILGGGTAGLAAAILLRREGWQVRIFECEAVQSRLGHGFIVQDNGLRVLEELGLAAIARERGAPLHQAELRTMDGDIVYQSTLVGAVGLLRRDLIDVLKAVLPRETIELGRCADQLVWDAAGHATAVRFRDGSCYEADLFVAGDGVHSAICRALFPDAILTPVRVKELVCHTHLPALTESLAGTFRKFQSPTAGLALGLVPCGDERLVWYLQADATLWPDTDPSPQDMADFVTAQFGHWAAPLDLLLEHTDFRQAHLWPTRDRDPLPAMHRSNVALIGDAAHPFLPFTSQGVGAALDDAIALAQCVQAAPSDLQGALARYSAMRLPHVARIVDGGRALRAQFLDPIGHGGTLSLPLVS